MSPDDLPDRHFRPGCETCGTQDCATVDGIGGRRCADHPAVFDPIMACRIAAAGWTDTALAYIRAAA